MFPSLIPPAFRWWSIELLRYTHAHLILHLLSLHSPIPLLFYFSFIQQFICFTSTPLHGVNNDHWVVWGFFPPQFLLVHYKTLWTCIATQMAKRLLCVLRSGTAQTALVCFGFKNSLFILCLCAFYSFFQFLFIFVTSSGKCFFVIIMCDHYRYL